MSMRRDFCLTAKIRFFSKVDKNYIGTFKINDKHREV